MFTNNSSTTKSSGGLPFYSAPPCARFSAEFILYLFTTKMECACEQTESLRGAAVNAYLSRFLERVGDAPDQSASIYQCRICGTRWLRQERDTKHPAQLRRLGKAAALHQEEEK